MYLKWLMFFKIEISTEKGLRFEYFVLAKTTKEAKKIAEYVIRFYYPKMVFNFKKMKCDKGTFIICRR